MSVFYGLFLLSQLPNAAGSVYKQKVLQGCDADVFYVTFWSGWFQILWGWLCIPLMWITLPGQAKPLAPGDTFKAIANTISCIAGQVPDPENDQTCAGAPPPWVWVIVYLAFNLTFNIAFTWLTKRMSAAWAQVATVLCLNLCNMFSSMKVIMGDNAQPLTLSDWLGAIIVSIALWVYNLEPETTADGVESKQHEQAKSSKSGSFVDQTSFKG